MRFIKRMLALAVLLWLPGACAAPAAVWDKPGVTEDQRKHDQLECAKTSIAEGSGTATFASFKIDRKRFNRCMEDLGYTMREVR